jgi:GntR family transcriptional regulator
MIRAKERSMTQPIYQQIADDLRTKIDTGELAAGAQLPTELDLRDKYEASRNTIRDAIKRLTSLGLVETRPGQGTFVVQKIDPFVTVLTGEPGHRHVGESATFLSEVFEKHRKAHLTTPRVEIQVPPGEISHRFRIEPSL